MNKRTQAVAELVKLVSDEDLIATFAGTNFGKSEPREILDSTILQLAGGWSTGHTALSCCRELGLVGYNSQTLTKKGKRYLYYSCKLTAIKASGAEHLGELVRALKACSTTGAGGKYYAEQALSKLPPELRGES